MPETKQVGTIDLTPTWEMHLSTCVMLIEAGDTQARAAAIMELVKMAKLADAYVASQKESK